MAHEITERSDGTAEAFFAGNGKELVPAWHGLGQLVIDAPNSNEALRLAQLDWRVQKVKALAELIPDAHGVEDGKPEYSVSEDYRAIVRSDNGRVLGFVSDRYHPVQNTEAFDFLDGLNQDGIVKYESAGSLAGGRKVWVLAKTGSIFEVAPGDQVQPYILFSTSHDGTSSIRITPTTVRVVCANTLRIALGRYGVGITLRHDGTVLQRIKAVKDVLVHAAGVTDAKLKQAQELVKRIVTKDEFSQFVDDLLPLDPEAERPGLRLKAREEVAWQFYSNPRNNLPGIERSAWAAYNSISEFADHSGKFRSNESRFNSTLEGGADALKQKAFDKALALV